MRDEPLRVISMPVDKGGCGFYRVRQPLKLLQDICGAETHVVDGIRDDMVEVTKALMVADIALVRQGGESGIAMIKEKPEFRNLLTVLDIDDNVEIISPYSEHYNEYGLEEFYDNNLEDWLWKDGEKRFDLESNRARVKALQQGLRTMDLVTVTTEKLANYARKYNKNVAVLPNAVEVEKWPVLPLKPNKKLRVGWQGGVSHYEDWYSIRRPLNDLMRKYDFTLVSIGSSYEGLIDPDNRKNLEVHYWVGFEAHSYRMATMNFDIALIPLADLPFNNYKSSIKFYEMSALALPCLVSNILPYKKDIIDGKNSLGFNSANDFYKALEALLIDARLRRKIGRNAREWVEKKHNARKQIKIWENVYTNLTEKKKGANLK